MSKLISTKIDNWLKFAQSSLYPYTCFICNQPGDEQMDLCHACSLELHHVNPTCSICDIKLAVNAAICGRCLKNPPHFNKVTTLYRYDGIAQHLIQSLKFKSKHACARIMGELMARHIKTLDTYPDAIIAVPLHATRLRERGFNQSELIAQHIHNQLGIPLAHQQLKRIINTASQASLKAPQRKKNLNKAFSYQSRDDIRSIAIIDDVVTTGSTANEIARTLKKNGVETVDVWAFARA